MTSAIVAAPGRFAVNGEEVRAVGPCLTHPGGERGLKQRGADPVHQDREPSSTGHAMGKGQMPAKEIEMRLTSASDIVAIHQEQYLRQLMQDPPDIARIVDRGKVLQKHRQA